MSEEIFQDLLKIIDEHKIARNEYLYKHTYTKLGGKADFFVTPTTYEEVQNIYRYCKDRLVPFTLIGNGSNLIVRDGGIRGVVVSLKHLNRIECDGDKIIAQSGASIIATSRKALEEHLTGLEFACGIPGTVGGAVFMNAGAYGGEIKDVLESCLVIDKNGDIVVRQAEELDLSYRYSNIQENGDIVLEATFQLRAGKLRRNQGGNG